MELDQKLRYAMLAFTVASMVLAGLGLHAGMHLRALDGGGRAD
jgi:hypothetical protein